MTEVIVFPDVEALVVNYLSAALPGYGWDVHVGTKVPDPRPDEFVRVIVTGGTQRDLIVDQPTIALEAWAILEPRAADLAALCRGLLYAMDVVDGVQFYHCDALSRPQNLPDPQSDQIRYTATYSLSYRGAAI